MLPTLDFFYLLGCRQRYWTGPITLISLFLVSHFSFVYSLWLPDTHYHIVSYKKRHSAAYVVCTMPTIMAKYCKWVPVRIAYKIWHSVKVMHNA